MEAGCLSVGNNAAERIAKFPVIRRRNYLFVGNDRAGCNSGNFYSLVTSAKLDSVAPFQWLRAIFEELPKYRNGLAFRQSQEGLLVASTELDHLLPDCWLQAHLEHQWTMDVQRRKEREQFEKRRSKFAIARQRNKPCQEMVGRTLIVHEPCLVCLMKTHHQNHRFRLRKSVPLNGPNQHPEIVRIRVLHFGKDLML